MISNATKEYLKTNQWLQDTVVAAGGGQPIVSAKPSLLDATLVIEEFLRYRQLTLCELTEFKGNSIQFEQTGKVFTTESELTQAILNSSSSRAVAMDKRLVAFVSTSANAVSSDVIFMHMMLNAFENGDSVNPFSAVTTSAIHSTSGRVKNTEASAHAGMSLNLPYVGHIGAGGAASTNTSDGVTQDVVTTGKPHVDAKYRETLSCLSTIYAMENTEILKKGQFTKTMARLALISGAQTDNAKDNLKVSDELMADPVLSMRCVNDAWCIDNIINDFMVGFCQDNMQNAVSKRPMDEEAVDFWSSAYHTIERNVAWNTKNMQRYVDHHDDPDAHMAFGLLKMMDILEKTARSAKNMLLRSVQNPRYSNTRGVHSGDSIHSLHLSPTINTDSAIFVLEEPVNNTLRSEYVHLKDATELFPELQQYTVEYGTLGGVGIKEDLWPDVIERVNEINTTLMVNDKVNDQKRVIVEDTSKGTLSLNVEHRKTRVRMSRI